MRGRLAPTDPPIAVPFTSAAGVITFTESGSHLTRQFIILGLPMLVLGVLILALPEWRIIAEAAIALGGFGLLCMCAAAIVGKRSRTVTVDLSTEELTERWSRPPLGSGERTTRAAPRVQIHKIELFRSGAFPSWGGWAAILHWEGGWITLAIDKHLESIDKYVATLPQGLSATEGPLLLARHRGFAAL